jgi:hypothetical protein
MVYALPGLSDLGRRMYHILLTAIERGYSAREFYRRFRGYVLEQIARELGIPPPYPPEWAELELRKRWQVFLSDWRIVKGAAETMYPLRFLPKTKRPAWEHHAPVTFLRPGEVEYRAKCKLRCTPCSEIEEAECPPTREEWVTIRDVVRLSPAEVAWQYFTRFIMPQNRCVDGYGCICEVESCTIWEAFRGIEPWE